MTAFCSRHFLTHCFEWKLLYFYSHFIEACSKGSKLTTGHHWFMMTSSNGNIFRVTGPSPVPVNSPHKGQWRGALMFSLICVWINGWVNKREAGDLRRHRGHYDVSVMSRKGLVPNKLQAITLTNDDSVLLIASSGHNELKLEIKIIIFVIRLSKPCFYRDSHGVVYWWIMSRPATYTDSSSRDLWHGLAVGILMASIRLLA